MQLILTLTVHLFFQTNTADTTIVFREISYSEIFEIAKKENKPVFLYFHFIGCSGCLKMEQTAFVDKKIYSFLNQNFICYSVNISKSDGNEVNKIYKVPGFPTFMFLDSESNIIHTITGIRTPDEFFQECLKIK